jgi:hypothetical protein
VDPLRRLILHDILLEILGTEHVYFQPPESIKLEYPCIIYNRDTISARHANNEKYAHKTRYQVTAIDRNPDSDWHSGIFELPLCRYDRHFVKDGLNHDVYELYF